MMAPGRPVETHPFRADWWVQSTEIYSQAFGADPEFYSFSRTLESYQALGNNSTLMLKSNSDLSRYLVRVSDEGAFDHVDGQERSNLARIELNEEPELDRDWSPGTDDLAGSVTVDSHRAYAGEYVW